MPSKASFVLSVAIMICAGWAVYSATAWPWKAALFPIVIGIPVFCLAAVEAVWSLMGKSTDAATDYQMSDLPVPVFARRTLVAVAWLLGLFAAIALIGFAAAVALFVFLFLVVQGKEGWLFSAVFAAVVSVVFHVLFVRLLVLPFPAGWLRDWTGF